MSQSERLLALLADGKPHRTDEIVSVVYGPTTPLARVAARIHDLKQRLPPGATIIGYPDKDNPALYWYRLVHAQVDVIEGVAPAKPFHAVKAANDPPKGELFGKRHGVTK